MRSIMLVLALVGCDGQTVQQARWPGHRQQTNELRKSFEDAQTRIAKLEGELGTMREQIRSLDASLAVLKRQAALPAAPPQAPAIDPPKP